MSNETGPVTPNEPTTSTTEVDAAADASAETGETPKSLLSATEDAGAPDEEDNSTDATTPEPLTSESFTLPEGVTLDEELMTGALAVFNDTELSPQDRAQKLIDLQIDTSQKAAEAATIAGQAAWDETQATWQKEARALPDIGGDNLDKTLATIKLGLEQVGATKDTFAALDLTGAGNNPEIIRILHALTAPLAEGGPVSGQPARGKLTQADRLFSSSAKS